MFTYVYIYKYMYVCECICMYTHMYVLRKKLICCDICERDNYSFYKTDPLSEE